jgi:hypothetical protein
VISVVIPTIHGREEHYARCVEAYEATQGVELQLITVRDKSTCGEAWGIGAEQAKGDYIHFSADDLQPAEGWYAPAIEACDRGFLPAPRIVNPAGKLDYCGVHGIELDDWTRVSMSVIPFMSRAQWDAIGPDVPPIHYFSDNWVSWRGAKAGFPTVVRRGFAFTHWWAKPGRGAGMSVDARMAADGDAFAALRLASA